MGTHCFEGELFRDEILFPDAQSAEAFATSWLADEEPGCWFEVVQTGPRFTLRIYEPDGYLINREYA